MALPDKQNTRIEKYLSVMAGQNSVDTLPEEPKTTVEQYLDHIARNGGGGSDVDKAYVDDQIQLVRDDVEDNYVGKEQGKGLSTNDYTDEDKQKLGELVNYDDTDIKQDISEIESVIPSNATPQNQLATATDVSGTAIPSTSTVSPVTDSADALVQGVTIYGRSEVVNGKIISAGEGYATVDLGTLEWEYISDSAHSRFEVNYLGIKPSAGLSAKANILCAKYDTRSSNDIYNHIYNKSIAYHGTLHRIWVYDTTYTDATIFKTAMSGVILAYQLADPTQGNTIAVKTDDGTGIDGTMAVFETALPLRSVSDTVRDVMEWGGSTGTVTKNCFKMVIDGNSNIAKWNSATNGFYKNLTIQAKNAPTDRPMSAISTVTIKSRNDLVVSNEASIGCSAGGVTLLIIIPNATTIEEAQTYLQNNPITLVYELATPVTTPLTTEEISAFRSLRTYDGTTNITITDEPDFEFGYLKNTDNGQAVADIQRDLQGQIDAINSRTAGMITVSPLLTLTAAGWDSTTKQQTVTFAHDTSRRNVIDITIGENAAWDAAGVYAVSETAAGITFECSEMPETALTFRVTSMEVS